MAIVSFTLGSVTPNPLPQGPGPDGSAQYRFQADSTDPVVIEVFARSAEGGPSILAGTVSHMNPVVGINTGSIDIDTSNLEPDVDYFFWVADVEGNASNDVGPVDVTCFVGGTLIMTQRGQVAVEDLRIGDLVLTLQGNPSMQPIMWIGHTRIHVARHPDPARVAPILVQAGALTDGVPNRDLRVSPEHALFLDGRLVPARLLLNGTSIVQELWRGEVTYWHVELPAHALLVSEGAISESYFDDGNRRNFDNHPFVAMVKDFESHRANGRYRENACAPLVEEPSPALTAILMRLSERAAAREDQAVRAA